MDFSLPSIVSIGIYNSDIAVKNRAITKNRKTTMFEIELPIEKGGVSYINSQEMPIDTDMVIVAKPGQMRHTKLPYKCYYIHMILKEDSLYSHLCSIPSFINTYRYEEYLLIFKELCKYYETTLEKDELLLHSLILKLIHTLSEDSDKLLFTEKAKRNNYLVIEAVMDYIKENLTENLSLEKTAEYAGFSPVYFHNCFKASTGMTLHSYIEDLRIKKAINELITTKKTLTEIAYECGFSSQSYFSYAFKKKMGLSPREYVKEVLLRYELKDKKGTHLY